MQEEKDMRIRPQLIHHWLFILLLAILLLVGHSMGAWAAEPPVANRLAATPTPTTKVKATPTEAATEETTGDANAEGKAAVSEDQILKEEAATKPIDTLEDAQNAVVQIEAVGTFMDPQEGMQMNSAGAGSGFIIDPSGIAVTNNHVATGAAFLKVFVAGEKEPRNARVLGVSECSDLAVIDIEGDGYPYLAWHPGQAKVGLEVYALGFPLGDPEFTMTKGIISKAKADGETSWASVGHVLEHTSTINPGNSGGPLVDKNGGVVGINYAGNADTKQYFAIAGADAQAVIEALRAGNNVDSVGINGEAVNDGKDIAGIWVSSVASGSPADKAGLKAGDIVLTMEGVTLANQGTMTEYCNILRSHKPADVLSMKVLRLASKEVLEGQINGRELTPSFSIADEVKKEEGATEADANSGSNKDYVDYSTIATKDNALSVDVPSAWSDVNEGDWKIDDKVVGTQLAASPDLKKFYDSWGTPGMLISYSQSLANTKTPQDLLNDIDYSKDCQTHSDQTALPKGYFVGYFERWEDCGDTKTQAVLVALTPAEAQDYVVLIEIYAVSPAELKALDHIIDSFVVRDQNTESSTTDTSGDQNKGSDINDIVDTSGLTYTYQFVSEAAISALLPEDWSDTASGDWVVDGKVFGKTFTAAPDMKKFQKSWTEPGIYVRTATLDTEVNVKEWLDELDLSDKCKSEGRTKHTHTIYGLTYTGAYDVWTDCEKSGNAYAYLVAASEPPGQLVVIEFQALDDADVQAFKVLLKSFFVEAGEPDASTASSSTGTNTGKSDEVDLTNYTVINDDSGKLSVRVPKAWSDTSSGNWLMDDKKVGLSLSAATNLKDYNDGWETPGMFFGVSTELAKDTDAKKFLDTWDYSKDCKLDSRIDYDDSVYAGAYDIWTNCGSKGNLFIVLSVMPKAKQDLIILVNVAIPAGTETQPFEQILASFDYNESGDAASNSTESNNTDTTQSTDDTQAATSEGTSATAEVIATTLNVRSGPGTNYEKLATIKKGQKFEIIGQINNCAWLKVKDSTGEEGWVSGAAQYVTIDTDCAQIPAAAAPAAPSGATTSGSSAANSGSTSSGNASKGCYNFQNNVGQELTITFTKRDGSWNKTFKVAKGKEHAECFDPGKYTYTLSAPGFESGNQEITISAGDNYNFPITPKN